MPYIFPLFVVSFTGKLELAFLQKADTTSDDVVPHSKTLTKCAQSARARLRHAESLQRRIHSCSRQPSEQEVKLLSDLRSGNLLYEANEATLKAGWGRIKQSDGSFQDITPNGGGIVGSFWTMFLWANKAQTLICALLLTEIYTRDKNSLTGIVIAESLCGHARRGADMRNNSF